MYFRLWWTFICEWSDHRKNIWDGKKKKKTMRECKKWKLPWTITMGASTATYPGLCSGKLASQFLAQILSPLFKPEGSWICLQNTGKVQLFFIHLRESRNTAHVQCVGLECRCRETSPNTKAEHSGCSAVRTTLYLHLHFSQ
jgi:hypothetical protein